MVVKFWFFSLLSAVPKANLFATAPTYTRRFEFGQEHEATDPIHPYYSFFSVSLSTCSIVCQVNWGYLASTEFSLLINLAEKQSGRIRNLAAEVACCCRGVFFWQQSWQSAVGSHRPSFAPKTLALENFLLSPFKGCSDFCIKAFVCLRWTEILTASRGGALYRERKPKRSQVRHSVSSKL